MSRTCRLLAKWISDSKLKQRLGNSFLLRDVTVVFYDISGYLSGNSLRVHFGVPESAQVESLNVRWTDGTMTTLALPDAKSVHYYLVSR